MYKSLEKYIVYFKESTSFYGSDPKPLNKIKCFDSDKQYYHKWIKDKLIDSILRVYCMSNTWSIITMATFSSDLFEGCRFMWYRDFEEIRTQIMWTSFPVKITSKRSCRNFLHWKRSFCWMKLNLIGLVRTPSQCSFQYIS